MQKKPLTMALLVSAKKYSKSGFPFLGIVKFLGEEHTTALQLLEGRAQLLGGIVKIQMLLAELVEVLVHVLALGVRLLHQSIN